MNYTKWKQKGERLMAVAVTLLMITTLILAAVPALTAHAASEPTVSITTDPKSGIKAFDDFSMDLNFLHNAYTDSDVTSVDITVTGVGGMSGSYAEKGIRPSGGSVLSYRLHVPEGKITYTGMGATTLLIDVKYNGKVTDSYSFQRTVYSIDGGGNDQYDPDEPVIPSPMDPPKLVGNAIIVKEGSPLQTINAGQSKTLRIQLSNTTNSILGKIQVSSTLPEGMTFNSSDATKSINLGRRETAELTLDVVASKEMASGTQTISLKAMYKYGSEVKTEEIPVYLKVTGMDEQSGSGGSLAVTNYKVDKSTVPAGDTFKLSVTVQNNTGKAVKGLQVKLDGLATEGITVNGGLDTQTIQNLASGASTTLTYNMATSKKLETGNQILTVSLKNGEEEVSSKVFVPVKGTKTSSDEDNEGVGMSKPQIIMQSYSFGESSVVGGQTFPLTLNVKNTSSVSAIENVKMTIESAPDETTGGVFTPANSSNTFFIARVPAGGVFTESIDMLVKADAAPKSYGLQVKFSYEAVLDGKRETLEATETITVPVTQPDRFEVNEVELYSPIYLGDSPSISVQFVNQGKSTIFNLSVEAEGENFTTGEGKSYIGNVESGASDSFDLSINPIDVGPLTGTLKFTYEDANGDTKEIIREFSAEVMQMDMPAIDDPGMEPMPEEPQGGLPMWAWILIGVGAAAVVAVVVIVVVVKVKARKKRLLEENDEFDDIPEDDEDEQQ